MVLSSSQLSYEEENGSTVHDDFSNIQDSAVFIGCLSPMVKFLIFIRYLSFDRALNRQSHTLYFKYRPPHLQ